jgi:pimeloyl-ACP methyl ester carboxylesterase
MAITEIQREQMKIAYADRSAIDWSLDNVLLGSRISPESRAQLIADALRLSPEGKAGWVEVGTREDFSRHVGRINVPVLIVAGELDRVDPIEVVKSDLIPHYPLARVHFLPSRGHLLPVEASQDVANLVAQFAKSL